MKKECVLHFITLDINVINRIKQCDENHTTFYVDDSELVELEKAIRSKQTSYYSS